jgi:serine/threonine-protein kinase
MPSPVPPDPAADRNLLYGILALQMDFIGRDDLIAALHAWVLEKSKPLSQVLADQGKLSPPRRQLLDALVDEHLHAHQGDPQQSLAALPSASSVRQALEQVADADVQASLARVPTADPPKVDGTVSYQSLGGSTAGLRYRVLRAHARGGLGDVFVAEDTELHREVALKEIRKEHAGDSQSRGRFVLEAEITGGLEHPGIVPIYGLGQYDDGRPFYAMRFIKGDNLKEAIARFHRSEGPERDPGERNVAFRELLGRFVDVCNATAYAHSRGVLHRDLKPGNVMLGNYGETLLIDWGLAKSVGRSEAAQDGEATLRPSSPDAEQVATRLGSAVGTPAFMSPEQAAGRLDQLGPASDIYSLGATLYALLTGRAPFAGESAEILRRAQQGDLVPPRQVKADVPAALEAACLKAMALRPEQRYRTALELAADVEHWLADEPVSAWREPLAVRGRRWLKRHRVLVMAAVTALLVGTLSLAAATVLLSAVNDELRLANERETEARQQAEAAQQEEAKTRRLAQANFEMANQAAEDYLFKVVEDHRLKERDLTELRQKLVVSAADFYTRFIAARQSDPTLRLMLGRAHLNLGMLKRELSQTEEAVQELRQAQDLLRELVAEAPGNPEYRFYLCRAGNELCRGYEHLNRLDDMARVLQSNLPLCERLAKEHPQDRRYRKVEEHCVRLQGRLLSLQGHKDRAESYRRRALALQRQIAKDYPEPEERILLSNILSSLGHDLSHLNRPKEARQCLEEGLAIAGELARAAPHRSDFREEIGSLSHELCWVLRDLGEPAAAQKAMQRAVDVRRQLVADFPNVPSHRRQLMVAASNLVNQLTEVGKHKEAVRLAREAVRLGEKLVADFPKEPEFRFGLAHAAYSLARALHHAGARIEGEKYRRLNVTMMLALCRDYPQGVAYQDQLGVAHSGLAYLLLHTDRLAEAREEGSRALAVFAKLVKEHPFSSEYQFRLAEACALQARTLAQLGEDNRDVLMKGLDALKPLVETQKKSRRYRLADAALTLQLQAGPPSVPGEKQGLAPLADLRTARAGIAGRLTRDDPCDILPLTWRSHRKVHRLSLEAEKYYQVDLTGDFDTFLRLEEGVNRGVLLNDNVCPPENLGSRLIFAPTRTAVYRFIVTSAKRGATGAYTLKVREADPAGPPQVIAGKLSEESKNSQGKAYQEHTVELSAGLAYTIELLGLDVDAGIGLGELGDKRVLATGVKSLRGKFLVPRIDFSPAADGVFRLIVLGEVEGQTGPYTIHIQGYKLAEP